MDGKRVIPGPWKQQIKYTQNNNKNENEIIKMKFIVFKFKRRILLTGVFKGSVRIYTLATIIKNPIFQSSCLNITNTFFAWNLLLENRRLCH